MQIVSGYTKFYRNVTNINLRLAGNQYMKYPLKIFQVTVMDFDNILQKNIFRELSSTLKSMNPVDISRTCLYFSLLSALLSFLKSSFPFANEFSIDSVTF